MNIFFLDRDIRRGVRHHSDRHVVKMALEMAPSLCSALWRHGVAAPYRQTHPNHPSVLWTGDSLSHHCWTRCDGLTSWADQHAGRRHESDAARDRNPGESRENPAKGRNLARAHTGHDHALPAERRAAVIGDGCPPVAGLC